MAALWNEWNKDNAPVLWLQSGAYQKKRQELYNQLHEEMKARAEKYQPRVIE